MPTISNIYALKYADADACVNTKEIYTIANIISAIDTKIYFFFAYHQKKNSFIPIT